MLADPDQSRKKPNKVEKVKEGLKKSDKVGHNMPVKGLT